LSQKILLSYFGELVTENGGVICKKPPEFFLNDYSTKALSAIMRLKIRALPVIIDFLEAQAYFRK
jgi:hypothetical protein